MRPILPAEAREDRRRRVGAVLPEAARAEQQQGPAPELRLIAGVSPPVWALGRSGAQARR